MKPWFKPIIACFAMEDDGVGECFDTNLVAMRFIGTVCPAETTWLLKRTAGKHVSFSANEKLCYEFGDGYHTASGTLTHPAELPCQITGVCTYQRNTARSAKKRWTAVLSMGGIKVYSHIFR